MYKSICLFKVTAVCLLVAVFVSTIAFSEPCNDCEISNREAEAADKLLFLNQSEVSDAIARHLPFGVPKDISDDGSASMLVQENYITWYDGELRIPIWVAYRLKSEDLANPLQREDCFRPDPRIPGSESATCGDYDEPVFDRGHMVPSADMRRSLMAMANTCVFTNIAPQHADFNRMIWAYVEGFTRDWAEDKGEIYVFSGCIFDSDHNGEKDSTTFIEFMDPSNRVAVPTHFFKIILFERPNGFIESMTFLLPHENSSPRKKDSKDYLLQHAVAIDTLESLTGIDFLTDLHERKQSAIERSKASALWPTN